MVRKTTDELARVKQQEMAQATIRKINRRLSNAPFDSYYRDFLLACREDVMRGQS